jgi:predicted kinase
MLIAMAGLPGSGKTTLAKRLATSLPAFRLDKDEVRAALFGSRVDYSNRQNDFCLQVMLGVAEVLFAQGEARIILDGRTFSQQQQVLDLKKAAEELAVPLHIIECVCADETARERLKQDEGHRAQNRSFDLYQQLQAQADPIPQPKLLLTTDVLELAQCVSAARDYLGVAR